MTTFFRSILLLVLCIALRFPVGGVPAALADEVAAPAAQQAPAPAGAAAEVWQAGGAWLRVGRNPDDRTLGVAVDALRLE